MLIGTYTNGSSKGIYTFRFNQETGTAVPLSSAALPNPSYLVPSGDGEFVYAVSEMNDSTAALSSLSLDRETGELRLLNTVPTFGADPCYVATNGREVLTANYSGGTMSVFPLQKDGTLAPADTLFQGSATGPDAIRQATPHIHCTVFSPDGKYIFATDFSAARILRFADEECRRDAGGRVNASRLYEAFALWWCARFADSVPAIHVFGRVMPARFAKVKRGGKTWYLGLSLTQ